jgi:hypothetical protein
MNPRQSGPSDVPQLLMNASEAVPEKLRFPAFAFLIPHFGPFLFRPASQPL